MHAHFFHLVTGPRSLIDDMELFAYFWIFVCVISNYAILRYLKGKC